MKRHTRGSALVVVLVLMSGLGALALAAAAAAMTALALAGHQQMAQNAFEAAESGIAAALLAATEARDGGNAEDEILPEIATARAAFRAETREAPGSGALPVRLQHRRERGRVCDAPLFHHGRRAVGTRCTPATRAGLLFRGAVVVSRRYLCMSVRAMALLAAALAAGHGSADMDEAWLHRAPLPASVRPLLALVLDRSEATRRQRARGRGLRSTARLRDDAIGSCRLRSGQSLFPPRARPGAGLHAAARH